MLTQMIHKERRVIQFYTLVLFFALSLIFFTVTFFIQTDTDRIHRSEVQIKEQSLVEIEKAYIVGNISERVTDTLYIADSLLLGAMEQDMYRGTTLEWIAFSNRKAVYDQMRYINRNGEEIVRINYTQDGAVDVPAEELQNKSDRYYFVNTMALGKGQVFISPLDLNVENGEIELPVKPVLRIATPIFENFERAVGIVVLNYAAKDLLRQVESIATASMGEVFLLNKDGYWLYNSKDSAKEWAFMYEDRLQESFANEYPQAWNTIQNTSNGFTATDEGIFSFQSVDLATDIALGGADHSLQCEAGVFYIVSHISPQSDSGEAFTDDILQHAGKVIMDYLSIYFLISGLAFVFAVMIGVNRAQNKEIKYFSEFDELTGVYNRRAGYRKLNTLKKDAARKDCRIAICYLDINGLKEVNDHLGHDAGDELIQTVAEGIRASIRGNDYVARLGGDEFLLVLDNLDETGAEMVWERILQKFERINAEENRAYIISVSHGFATHVCGTNGSVDNIINQADEMMYKEKREIKKTLRVVRREEQASRFAAIKLRLYGQAKRPRREGVQRCQRHKHNA